jgi:hypothetical protein
MQERPSTLRQAQDRQAQGERIDADHAELVEARRDPPSSAPPFLAGPPRAML